MSESDIEILSSRFRDLDRIEVTCSEINTAYITFHWMFVKIFKLCCPIIQINANCKSSQANACQNIYNLYKVFLKR